MLMQEDNPQGQPGQVINPVIVTPDTATSPAPRPVQPESISIQHAPTAIVDTTPTPVAAPTILPPVFQEAPQPNPFQNAEPTIEAIEQQSSFDHPEPAPQQQNVYSEDGGSITWTASEYIANAKTSGWFMTLGLITVAVDLAIYLATKSILSTVMVGICGVLIMVFAARQPQVLSYRIDQQGLHIGEKFYAYSNFKSFSMVVEHAMGYVSLSPLRRFMPPLAIHYSPEDEDKIIETLADYLPYEEHKPDVIDSLTRRARF
jgi:hypothetical protein